MRRIGEPKDAAREMSVPAQRDAVGKAVRRRLVKADGDAASDAGVSSIWSDASESAASAAGQARRDDGSAVPAIDANRRVVCARQGVWVSRKPCRARPEERAGVRRRFRRREGLL